MTRRLVHGTLVLVWAWPGTAFVTLPSAKLGNAYDSRMGRFRMSHQGQNSRRERDSQVDDAIDVDLSTTKQILARLESIRSTEEREIAQAGQVEREEGGSTIRSLSNSATLLGTLLAGTYASSCVLTDLLANFEMVQAWRYSWPFGIGALYMILNFLPTLSTTNVNEDGRSFPLSYNVVRPLVGESGLFKALFFALGLGLVIGGGYDAWMPVYETGPNVITEAGIGQDAALGLYFATLFQMIRQPQGNRPDASNNSQFLLQVLLLAQLYKLGEGSFDELFFSNWL